MLATTTASYLETLNPEQRRAVEHGVSADGHVGTPLLVIAGAGSGMTNTPAHCVAHLIVSGADPRRILLMTFSRRAASEMAKRVERIARKVLGADAGIMTDALSWAGTFHGIGARLLREYADQIGVNPAFTIQLEARTIECECSPTEWEWRVCGPSGWLLMLGWRPQRGQAQGRKGAVQIARFRKEHRYTSCAGSLARRLQLPLGPVDRVGSERVTG